MKQSIAPGAIPSSAGALPALMYITNGRLKCRGISHHRRRIRELENEERSIGRMLDALDARFPQAQSGASQLG